MLAKAVDSLAWLVWSKTEDARHGMNRPQSFARILTGQNSDSELNGYSSGEEFMKAWNA